MSELTKRIAALSPERRRLFELLQKGEATSKPAPPPMRVYERHVCAKRT